MKKGPGEISRSSNYTTTLHHAPAGANPYQELSEQLILRSSLNFCGVHFGHRKSTLTPGRFPTRAYTLPTKWFSGFAWRALATSTRLSTTLSSRRLGTFTVFPVSDLRLRGPALAIPLALVVARTIGQIGHSHSRRIRVRKLIIKLGRSARGAKPLEVIGTYNPIPKKPTNLYDDNAHTRPFKEIALDRARAKYWLGVGAQPSDPVWKLMGMVSWTYVLRCRLLGGDILANVISRCFTHGLALLQSGITRCLLDGFANMAFMCRLVLSSRSLLPSTRHNVVPTVSPSGLFSLTTVTDLSIMGIP